VATAPSSPTLAGDLIRSPGLRDGDGTETAETTADVGRSRLNPLVARLPVEVDVAVPIRAFTVRNLIALAKEQVIESQWDHAEDLPLAAREVQLAWCEFEVMDTRLAVRITRLG